MTPLRVARSRGRIRGVLALLGPGFVAAVAYVDPRNFATNVSEAPGTASCVPPFAAGLMTAVVAFAILGLQTHGYRGFEFGAGVSSRRNIRADPHWTLGPEPSG